MDLCHGGRKFDLAWVMPGMWNCRRSKESYQYESYETARIRYAQAHLQLEKKHWKSISFSIFFCSLSQCRTVTTEYISGSQHWRRNRAPFTPRHLVPCSCESPKAIPQAMPGRGIDTGYHGIMVVSMVVLQCFAESLRLGCWHLWADSGKPHFGNPMKSLCISPGLWQPEAPKPKNPKSPSMVMTKRPVHQTHGFLHHF